MPDYEMRVDDKFAQSTPIDVAIEDGPTVILMVKPTGVQPTGD